MGKSNGLLASYSKVHGLSSSSLSFCFRIFPPSHSLLFFSSSSVSLLGPPGFDGVLAFLAARLISFAALLLLNGGFVRRLQRATESNARSMDMKVFSVKRSGFLSKYIAISESWGR